MKKTFLDIPLERVADLQMFCIKLSMTLLGFATAVEKRK